MYAMSNPRSAFHSKVKSTSLPHPISRTLSDPAALGDNACVGVYQGSIIGARQSPSQIDISRGRTNAKISGVTYKNERPDAMFGLVAKNKAVSSAKVVLCDFQVDDSAVE